MIQKTPRFFRLGNYTSNDEDNPDKVIFKIISFEKFRSEHTTNIIVELKTDLGFVPRIFPLKPCRQESSDLLELWNENVKTKNFKKGKIICLHTWKKGGRFWKLSEI